MFRSALSKVAWVGRTASMVFGLALVLALVVGLASTALSATGGNFILGQNNAADVLTRLTGNVNGSAMQVVNKNPDANDTALSLSVQSGEAPMRVNSGVRVANLNAATAGRAESAASADNAQNATNAANADKLDDNDSDAFQKRVSGACAVGSSIRSIDANGVVTCEQDDSGASGAAGGDLTGNYPNPQIANGAVAGGLGGKITDNTVNSDDVTLNSLRQDDIAPGGVGSDEVANGSLDVADVTEVQFNFTVDPPPINGQSCFTNSQSFSTVDGGDLVIVNAADDLPSGLVMFPLAPTSSNPQINYRLCNITSSTIDAPSGGGWRLAVFDDGNDN